MYNYESDFKMPTGRPVKAKEHIVGEAASAFNIAAKGFYVLCITNRILLLSL